MTRKGRNSNGGRLGRKEVTMLGPFEVDNIRRGGRARKVDVASGVGEETEKGALRRVRQKFRGAPTRRADPDAATKCTEVREVVNLSEGKGQGRGSLIAGGQGVANTKPMLEGVGPEANLETSTSEQGANGVGNS